MKLGVRAAAARALTRISDDGESLEAALRPLLDGFPDSRDRALCQACVYGVARHYPLLEAILGQLLTRPLKARDAELRQLLLVGLFQLRELDVPPHAAVSATVDACDELGRPWARRLLNGVLRNAIRQADELATIAARTESARLCHPDWFIEALRSAWPEHWEQIVTANNAPPPLSLRVNLARSSRERYLALLEDRGIAAVAGRHAGAAVRLVTPINVDQLPDFAAGACSVQDEAAQLAAELTEPEPGQRILDACAAPGGKTGQLCETAPSDCTITALDVDPRRTALIESNLARLGLSAQVLCADATDPSSWWDGQQFDRILVDAPCTATGVVRRHPDIKLHRTPADGHRQAERQLLLLQRLWPLLGAGGKLVYITCSVLPEENSDVVERFLDLTPDARLDLPPRPWGQRLQSGYQILPGTDDMDGFFCSRIEKL